MKELFKKLKKELLNLEKLLQECNSHWGYEDPVYRFYHQSHKVYSLQETTMEIVKSLQELSIEGLFLPQKNMGYLRHILRN